MDILFEILTGFFEWTLQSFALDLGDIIQSGEGEKLRIFGMRPINGEDSLKLIWRFLINSIFIVGLVRYIYYPSAKRKDFLFTYILVSTVVFLLCFMLENVKIDLAFALGLFAIFGIIRYRTDAIPIKEMTYLFIVIGLSVMNALVNKKISYGELLFANLAVIAFAYGMERIWFVKHQMVKSVVYDNIDLVHADRIEELKADLTKRTGMEIVKIEIERIDYLRDTAHLLVSFVQEDKK